MHTEAKTNLLGEDHEWVLIVEDQKNLRELSQDALKLPQWEEAVEKSNHPRLVTHYECSGAEWVCYTVAAQTGLLTFHRLVILMLG